MKKLKLMWAFALMVLLGLGGLSCADNNSSSTEQDIAPISTRLLEAVTENADGFLNDAAVQALLSELDSQGTWPIIAEQPILVCNPYDVCSSGSAEYCDQGGGIIEYHYYECILAGNGVGYDGTVVQDLSDPSLALYTVNLLVATPLATRFFVDFEMNFFDLDSAFLVVGPAIQPGKALKYSVSGTEVTITGVRSDNDNRCTVTVDVDAGAGTYAVVSAEACGITGGVFT